MVEKSDAASGEPLRGVVLRLTDLFGNSSTATTGALGTASFQLLANYRYMLAEIRPPSGYQPNRLNFDIRVNAQGLIFIDGVQTNTLYLENTPVGDGQITINYLNQTTGGQVFPSQTIAFPPGPYSVDTPPAILPLSPFCNPNYLLLLGSSGAPVSGTIQANAQLEINFLYGIATCPENTEFDPQQNICTADCFSG